MNALFLSVISSIVLLTSGCSVYMAAHQPDYKNLNSIKEGADRDYVLMSLGTPITTESDAEGNKIDLFKFRQGYGMGNKAVRMVGHGVADVFTLGLWEVIATPGEAICNGRDVTLKIFYGKDQKVTKVMYLNENKSAEQRSPDAASKDS